MLSDSAVRFFPSGYNRTFLRARQELRQARTVLRAKEGYQPCCGGTAAGGMMVPNDKEGVVEDLREKIRVAVRDAAVGGRLSCEKAHELGTRLNIPLQEIGRVCNELNIKIKDCQLGCF